MTSLLSAVVASAALALALWAGWSALRDRPVVLRQLWGGAVVEALLLVQAVVSGIRHATGAEAGAPTEPVVFWGYVVTQAVLLPAAALWAFAERSRWSSVVLAVAAVAVAFLQLRLGQTWSPR